MRRLLLAVLLGCISFSLTGCGGCGTTEADMRAYAIRRSSDDDEAKPPPKKPVPAPPKKEDQKPLNAAQSVKPAAAFAEKPAAPETPAPPEASEAAAGLAAPVAKPAAPLTVVQRRTMTIENLTNVSNAIRRHLREKGTYPDDHGRNLSWRVMLLPYLNQTALFDQFHLDEPWDSPHNKALLPHLPAVYRSPERFDEKTNYLLLVNDPAAYSRRLPHYVDRRRFEDGLEQTILLIEAADADAVPWTKPEDFNLEVNKIASQLGKLREDGLFVVFADGHLGLLPSGMSPELIMTLVTCDSGDNPQPALALVATPTAEPKAGTVASADPAPAPTGGSIPDSGLEVVDPLAPPSTATGATDAAASPPAQKEPDPAAPATPGTRMPVPDSIAINKAKVLLEEIYRSRIDKARNREEQARLAKEMLDDLSRLKDDPAGQYVLLEGVRKLALQASDAVTALDAVEELGRRFDVDATTMRIEAVSEFARSGSYADEAANEIVLNYAIDLMNQALAEDNFVGAQKMYDIAITAARRVDDPKLVRQLQEHKEEVAVARAAYAEVEKVIEQLGADPYAPGPNLTVGKYYCFVKGEWSRGLPMLARGDDEELRQLAEMELDPPALADKQLELAERWWAVGEKHPMPLRRQMQLRAVSWYQKAQANLPDGLRKVKVEVRLREAQRVYGREVVGDASVAGSSR